MKRKEKRYQQAKEYAYVVTYKNISKYLKIKDKWFPHFSKTKDKHRHTRSVFRNDVSRLFYPWTWYKDFVHGDECMYGDYKPCWPDAKRFQYIKGAK